MAKILKIELTSPTLGFVHQFRNFGEDVFRDLRQECSVSIAEIDAATSVFYVRDLRAKFVRSAAARVRTIALRHQMEDRIEVTEEFL